MLGSHDTSGCAQVARVAAVAGVVFAVLLTVVLVLVRSACRAIPSPPMTGSVEGGRGSRSCSRWTCCRSRGSPCCRSSASCAIGSGRGRTGLRDGVPWQPSVCCSSPCSFRCRGRPAGSCSPDDQAIVAFRPAVWCVVVVESRTPSERLRHAHGGGLHHFDDDVGVRLRLVPRWLAVAGYLTAAALLLTVGSFRALELLFPAWRSSSVSTSCG